MASSKTASSTPPSSKTLYFAIGYFTAAQRGQRDRAILAAGAPPSNPVVSVVEVTLVRVNTGIATLNLGIEGESKATTGPYFHIERFWTNFPPPNQSAADAFDEYLKSPGGIMAFQYATSVQLFHINVSLDPP